MFELRLGPDDVARVRFGVSPLWETAQAVRSLLDPRQRPYHLPWLEQVRPVLDRLDLLPLFAIMPMRGYTPDVVAPGPERPGTTAEEQIARVRTAPLERVRAELERTMTDRAGAPVPAELTALARDPRAARTRLADALEACWQQLVAPYWPRINDLLAADIAHHSRLLAEGGLERVLPALHRAVIWRPPVVRVETGGPRRVRAAAGGRGLLLQPTAFGWPLVAAIWEAPYQPTVVYPARGVAELWQPVTPPAAGALGVLLGRTRATLLASVREPAGTTTLARRHGLAAATVSEHLSALAGAGLVAAVRTGRTVLYATTSLGDALLAGRGDAAGVPAPRD